MIIHINDLTNKQLNDAVARAIGWKNFPSDSVEHGDTWYKDKEKAPFCQYIKRRNWNPSTNWNDIGPLITKYHIQFTFSSTDIAAIVPNGYWCAGGDHLIAACRAIVNSVYGDYISFDS